MNATTRMYGFMSLAIFSVFGLIAAAASSCATLASDGQGNVDLPNQTMGPFRLLKHGRTCINNVCTGVEELPKNTSDGQLEYPKLPAARSPTVLLRTTAVAPLAGVLYLARDIDPKADRIVRMASNDIRNFPEESATDVLTADQPWEGESMSDPFALDVDYNGKREVWLFYSVLPNAEKPDQKAGIGLARSTDGAEGKQFVKHSGPVLTFDGANPSWETAPPRSPTVVRTPDGKFHLFYASGKAIGEAISDDGLKFVRMDGDPLTTEIDPVVKATPAVPDNEVNPETGLRTDGTYLPFDDEMVDDPHVQLVTTAAGRLQFRLLYTGRDRRGNSAIGFASRFGSLGPFDKNAGAILTSRSAKYSQPAVATFKDFSMIFAFQPRSSGGTGDVMVGIAPADRKLPFPFVP